MYLISSLIMIYLMMICSLWANAFDQPKLAILHTQASVKIDKDAVEALNQLMLKVAQKYSKEYYQILSKDEIQLRLAASPIIDVTKCLQECEVEIARVLKANLIISSSLLKKKKKLILKINLFNTATTLRDATREYRADTFDELENLILNDFKFLIIDLKEQLLQTEETINSNHFEAQKKDEDLAIDQLSKNQQFEDQSIQKEMSFQRFNQQKQISSLGVSFAKGEFSRNRYWHSNLEWRLNTSFITKGKIEEFKLAIMHLDMNSEISSNSTLSSMKDTQSTTHWRTSFGAGIKLSVHSKVEIEVGIAEIIGSLTSKIKIGESNYEKKRGLYGVLLPMLAFNFKIKPTLSLQFGNGFLYHPMKQNAFFGLVQWHTQHSIVSSLKFGINQNSVANTNTIPQIDETRSDLKKDYTKIYQELMSSYFAIYAGISLSYQKMKIELGAQSHLGEFAQIDVFSQISYLY
jgi:hypothetical protein